MKKLNDFIMTTSATGFGSGYLPIAPGTWGSALALIIYVLLLKNFPLWLLLPTIAATYALGVIAADYFDNKEGTKDNGKIVIDEFVGQWITLLAVAPTIFNLIAAFFIFRLFDIVKPYPIRKIDSSLKNGQGVMLDDLVAGLYSLITLQLLIRFLPLGLLS